MRKKKHVGEGLLTLRTLNAAGEEIIIPLPI